MEVVEIIAMLEGALKSVFDVVVAFVSAAATFIAITIMVFKCSTEIATAWLR